MGEVIWNPVFTRRQNLNLVDLGKPYIEWKVEIRGGDGATTQDALVDADIISMFMRDDDDIRISPEADRVEAFCGSITLRSLITAREGGPPLEPIALLDIRLSNGGIISSKHNEGPLTVRQLYQALMEPLSLPSHIRPSNDTEEPLDTRWRHIYITDLNRWSISAIIGTTLRYQRLALRSMVYMHLQFRPWIGVNIPTAGKRFELAFHLPYTPMRDSATPKFDLRRFGDGQTLRRLEDVSFLNLGRSHIPTFRYEAQISCVVVGKHDSTWDSYRFDDTYFDPVRDGKRMVVIYDEQRIYGEESEDPDGARFAIDPSSRGRRGRLEESASESDPPALDPRQFFLRVLKYDLEHITVELRRNVDRIDDSIRDYRNRQFEYDLQNLIKKRPASRKLQATGTIEQITKVKDLSKTSSGEVSDMTDAIQTFFDNHETLFKTDLCDPLVFEITAILKEWVKMKKILESAVKQCQNFIEDEQFWLDHESLQTGRKNQFLSKFIYPIVIVAGMFSMENHVLPFTTDTRTFVGMVVLLGFLIDLCYHPSWYWQAVLTAADRLGFTERFQAMRPDLGEISRTEPFHPTPSDQSKEPPGRTFPWRGRNHTPRNSAGQMMGV